MLYIAVAVAVPLLLLPIAMVLPLPQTTPPLLRPFGEPELKSGDGMLREPFSGMKMCNLGFSRNEVFLPLPPGELSVRDNVLGEELPGVVIV